MTDKFDVFTWGDDSAISIMDALGCMDNGQYFEPTINLDDLLGLLNKGVHHSSAIGAKLNILKSTFVPTKYLSRAEFEKLAFNFLVTGNGYLEATRNRFGEVLYFKARLSLYMRRASNLKDFCYIRDSFLGLKFDTICGDDIAHILQPDLRQEVYGVPYYLAGINSIELNASATKFRRRYYDNGSHAGFILYSTDPGISDPDWENIKKQLAAAKGNGNFKNMALRSASGKSDALTLIPISEVAAKDEFLNIKTVSQEDMLAIHRVPPALMGIVPKSAGGNGDVEKSARVFAKNEVAPIQESFKAINEHFGLNILSFIPYEFEDQANK